MYRIGIFATGRGQGSRGLLEAIHQSIQSGYLPAEVAFVFSNRQPGEFEATDGFFNQVREYGYPLLTLSFRRFRGHDQSPGWRALYERQVAKLIEPYKPDLCVLAGFLLIVPELSRLFPMVNLHPAAPGGPAGIWQDVIWQLIERSAKFSGNTMLSVTEDLDRGPTATYCTFPICGDQFHLLWKEIKGRSLTELKAKEGETLPLFQAIRRHGMLRERPLVVETVKSFAEGRLAVTGGQVLEASGMPTAGVDLTPRIEEIVRGQTRAGLNSN